MNTPAKTASAILVALSLTGQAWAAGSCARPDEVAALKTAAVQQKLMVAALYCSDVGPYNRFVVSYQTDLRKSDAALLHYFERVRGGDSGYHAYKTSLANGYSLSSIHAQQRYCAAANATFDAALSSGNKSLADFIGAQSVPEAGAYEVCGTLEANAAPATSAVVAGGKR